MNLQCSKSELIKIKQLEPYKIRDNLTKKRDRRLDFLKHNLRRTVEKTYRYVRRNGYCWNRNFYYRDMRELMEREEINMVFY